MSVTAFIRRCLDAGMPVDIALTAAEAFEAEAPVYVPPVKSKGAERAARYRGRKRDETVTKRDDVTPSVTERDEITPLPLSPSSPRPPSSTNPNQVPPYTPHAKPNGFARFWEAYPSKVAKRAAERAFPNALRRITASDPLAVLLAGVDRAKRTRKWREGFIPNPATWLNGDCWEDDPDGELARASRPPPKAEPAVYAAHLRHFRDTGEWKPTWGEKPNLESAA